jgi:hypothetical protein
MPRLAGGRIGVVLARRRTQSAEVPPELVYDPAHWGATEDGIRAWGRAAAAWLEEDPDRRLPIGKRGDVLDVLRERVRLIGEL